MNITPKEIAAAHDFVRGKVQFPIQVGLVLGSGLGALADLIEKPVKIPYSHIPHFPKSTVQGHSGQFVAGFIDGVSVLAMQGRTHFYEGYSFSQVTLGIRIMAQMAVRNLILTNAAGALNPAFKPGDFMLITDHINLMGSNPLIGPHHEEWGDRFVDQSHAYSEKLRLLALDCTRTLNQSMQQGVYAGVSGPAYETPAEVRMLQKLGADAVGMSTIPETIVAVQSKMHVLAISLMTNMAAGLSHALHHSEVVEIAHKKSQDFQRLIIETIKRIDHE